MHTTTSLVSATICSLMHCLNVAVCCRISLCDVFHFDGDAPPYTRRLPWSVRARRSLMHCLTVVVCCLNLSVCSVFQFDGHTDACRSLCSV
jgi:hypothetical protein